MSKLARKLNIAEKDVPLVLTIFTGFFIAGITNTGLGAILPNMIKEYNMDYTLAGLIQSSSQIGNLIAIILSGFLANVLGKKNTLVIFFSGIIIGMTLIAITGNIFGLAIAFALIGVARGATSNISNSTISDISKDASSSLNILHSVFALGSVIAPLLVMLLSKIFGWRGFPVFAALIGIPVFILIIKSDLDNTKIDKEEEVYYSFFKSKSYWLIIAILFFYLCGENALIGWMVTYFIEIGVVTETYAKVTLSILWIVMMIGRILYATFPLKISDNKLLIISAVMQFGFFLLMFLVQNIIFITIGIIGLGLGLSIMYPTTIGTMRPEYAKSTMAMGVGISISTLGAILMPLLIGTVADSLGIKWGMGIIIVTFLILILLTIMKNIYEKDR